LLGEGILLPVFLLPVIKYVLNFLIFSLAY